MTTRYVSRRCLICIFYYKTHFALLSLPSQFFIISFINNNIINYYYYPYYFQYLLIFYEVSNRPLPNQPLINNLTKITFIIFRHIIIPCNLRLHLLTETIFAFSITNTITFMFDGLIHSSEFVIDHIILITIIT